MSYASGTTVSVCESRQQLRALLERFGATNVSVGRNAKDEDVILFTYRGRSVRYKASPRTGEQEYRAQWRALLLMFKAKLQVVESGLAGFDDEFLAYVALPQGGDMREVASRILPALGR